MPCIVCIQEMCKSSSSSSDQKVIQQSSEIEMLNTKLETLRKQHMQLIDIHSKCKIKKSDDQVRHSVAIHNYIKVGPYPCTVCICSYLWSSLFVLCKD